MSRDPELARLRQRYPINTPVRTGPHLVDKGVHIVIGWDRMHWPFQSAVLVLKTPDGEIRRGTPDMWRIAT